jgi:glycosyltransferase involved in cell wall biosynthesis
MWYGLSTAMPSRIPQTVVHYGLFDPRQHTGGVETFARNLGLVFEDVLFMTPETRDESLVRREKLPVICDNQWVLDWPEDLPVIGFQHGVALVKSAVIPGRDNASLAWRQRKAAKRKNTLWVACAQWISHTFGRVHGNKANHVVYHAVDLDRFDGKLDNAGSRLVLHDGRTPHKGSKLYPRLERAFPDFRFETLSCRPEEVPDRMRRAAAFVHLSLYEGNSIVCNEAMAMDLPCLFTRVGLMRDGAEQFDVAVLRVRDAFVRPKRLVEEVGAFLSSLERPRHPRGWVLEHASFEANRTAWQRVVDDFRTLSWS